MTSILSVASSGLAAAQIGLTTTGHNIANANTKGYSRQVVLQGAVLGQDTGVGYVGKGTVVSGITRIYDDYLATRVNNTQSTASSLDSYYTQIQQVNNMLSDSSGGLAPAMQSFFDGIQTLSSDPNSSPGRQSMLSGADQLVASFHALNSQMSEIRDGVNTQISNTVDSINSYASQIAKLNDAIEVATGGVADVQAPNDLLDQRDQLVADLTTQVKATVVKQGNSYNVFIGNGQPMVVGTNVYNLAATVSKTDVSRTEIAYVTPNSTVTLAESALTGGALGGLLDFRSQTLDPAVNSLGRVATAVAMSVNAQHNLGQDQNGAIGGDFFVAADPLVKAATDNTGTGVLSGKITDISKLTNSDYQLSYDGTNYSVSRQSDGQVMYNAATPPASEIDGVTFNFTGASQAGDRFLVRPTANGAATIALAITDITKIAAAVPIRATAGTPDHVDPLDPTSPLTGTVTNANTGSGKISAGTVNGPAPVDPNLQQPVSITFTSPTTFDVSGTGTGNPTGLTYTPGQDISYNGWTVQISGAPNAGDTFAVGANTNGVGDSRNALLLSGLQTAKTLDNGASSFSGVYGQLVASVGNKTHELEVTSTAENTLLTQAVAAQQSQSGVNLDEEATNLLKYQQAYAAAGKVMATAQKMFDILISLGAV